MSLYHRAPLSALLFLVVGIDHVKPSQQVTEKIVEDRQVTRLPPSAFTQVPTEIRRELKRRGCTIPQLSSGKKPQNVIKGEFIGKGRADWAVLCSLNGSSRILIFTNASGREPLERRRMPIPFRVVAALQSNILVPSRRWATNTFLCITAPTAGPSHRQSITKELVIRLWERRL